MKNKISLIVVCILCFNLQAKEHPFLFTTKADIARAKDAVKSDKDFAAIAEALVDRCDKADLSKLPELDFQWASKSGTTNLSLHTYHKPRPWALMAQDCARASVFKPELAAKAREALLHLSQYEFGKLPRNSGLNHARVAYPALDAYDIIYDTLSDDDRANIDAYFEKLIDAVIEDNDFWVANNPGGIPVNNHVCWHNLAIAMYGAFYDKPELINRAIYSKRGMEFMLNFGFRDGGLWGEASVMYCLVAIEPILIMAEMLEKSGYPVSLYEPTADGRDLKQAYDSFFQLMLPDGYFPRVGDTYGRRHLFGAGMPYEILYNRFGDEKYAWLINRQEKRDSSALFYGKTKVRPVKDISIQSVLLPEQGYAFLRTNEGSDYWNGKGWTLMASYSDVYVHRHLDRLSIMLFGDGHLWLTDPGMKFIGKSMNWDIVKGFNRHTVSHNTLMVDDKIQTDLVRRLDLVEYSDLPAVKRVSMADYSCQLYPGVKQMRTCIATEGYVLDVFQVISKENHKYSWISHISGDSKSCSVDDFESITLPQGLPWIYLKEPHRGRQGVTAFTEKFTNGDKNFGIDVVTDSPCRVVKCLYALDDTANLQTEPTRILEITGKTAIFAAVYRTQDIDRTVRVSIKPAEMNNLLCEVAIGEEKYLHRLPHLQWTTDTPE